MRKRALIIAGSVYGDEALGDLPSAVSDAEQLSGVLSDRRIGEFAVDTLLDEQALIAKSRIEGFFQGAAHNDLLLLHLSCHGLKDRKSRLVFAASDTDTGLLASTGIAAEFINDQIEESRSKSIVVMLDCCYSGAFSKGMRARAAVPEVDVAQPFTGRGRVVMTSSTSLQYSFEGEQRSRREFDPALFTAAVIHGLKSGEADLDGDGFVAVEELYSFVHDRVKQAEPRQTPTLSVNSAEGSIYLARSPSYVLHPEFKGLPGRVISAIHHQEAWQRYGALHLLVRELNDQRDESSDAALKALSLLAGDPDAEVRRQASSLLRRFEVPVPVHREWESTGHDESVDSDWDVPVEHLPPRQHGRAVGIDLGTTNSVVAILEGGEPTVIANAEGSRTTPSVVAFAKNGEVLVGEVAKRQAVTNVDRTIRSVKREMGTDWKTQIDGKDFTPQQISAFVLQKLKRDAESYLGETVTDAVITVPAYFSDHQRQATKEAGQIAGLNVLRVITDPSSAALAYHLEKENEAAIMIFDLGAAMFSVSLLRIGSGVVEVVATSGDNHLGGEDWDEKVVDWLVEKFRSAKGVNLWRDKMALQRLREAAEKAKIELTNSAETQINLPYITASSEGPLHLDEKITRAEFQRMTADLLERTKAPFQQVLKDAGYSVDGVDQVVLVGGSTRMPAVSELVKELTGGKEPNKGVNPDEVVAIGASLQAGVLKGEVKDALLLEATTLSLGIETSGGHRLGIEAEGGIFTKIIERNISIPTKRSETFTTADDNQPSVEIQVYQGEREIAAYNKKLGTFQLTGLPPAPRGVPQIEVTFDIDANGIVNVSAKDQGTGREQSMVITGGSALPKDDIEKMMRDAEQYAEEDRRRKEEAEVRNQADTLAYSTEKFLRENDEKVPEELKTEVGDAVAEVKKALEGTDVDAIKGSAEKLAQISQKMGAAVYAQDR
ncbi:molecular chaperone DnaK [Actinomadura decatromicini]|uniref:Chaperone protein DnaK n=1 Tax=Actinomadura decatromicini TaxID=2604572 RepID=A0A5D3FY58_9ACTN|nr:molecular chaperone DnaK [Actinomadura decatromicini]